MIKDFFRWVYVVCVVLIILLGLVAVVVIDFEKQKKSSATLGCWNGCYESSYLLCGEVLDKTFIYDFCFSRCNVYYGVDGYLQTTSVVNASKEYYCSGGS